MPILLLKIGTLIAAGAGLIWGAKEALNKLTTYAFVLLILYILYKKKS
ncbi:hypothetical protein DFX45_RS21935 [Vibrio parahaemolyticus]|nr:hypothetical protein [Vibrio parahaemolyticus]